MLYTISYELKKPNQDYADLYNAIKGVGSWAHCPTSHWFVDTQLSANQIYDRLKPFLGGNDLIFITTVGRDYRGILSQEVLNWLNARISA
jgi:hypothetical protein